MSMRYLWVDDGNDPDFIKGEENGITGYFLALGGVRTTKAALLDIAGRGRANGVYVGAGWWNSLSPTQYAARLNTLLNPIRNSSTRVMVNLEEHDPARVVAILTEIRRLNPKTGLSWALEGMQGGWARGIASQVNDLRVRVVPELFVGNMANIDLRASDPAKFYDDVKANLRSEAAVLADLVGFNAVSLFHPGEWLTPDAEGYVFTQGRLP